MYFGGNVLGGIHDFFIFEKTDGNDADPDGGFLFTMQGNDNVQEIAMTIRGNKRVGLQTVTNPAYALELPNNADPGIGHARATAWATYSDGRLKKQRKQIPYGLATVLQLNPLSYQHHNSIQNSKEDQLLVLQDHRTSIGFIAQELETIIPEAVYRPQNETKDLWAVDYSQLIPVLTKAIQEQQLIINELKNQIKQLQNKY